LQDLPYCRHVRILEQNWGITSSVWAVGAGECHLVDVGVPELDLTDPWGLGPAETALGKTEGSDDQLLSTRALLGRIYNRVMKTQGPFDWLMVAGGLSTETESLFLGACDALWRGSGSRILSVARQAFARPLAETPVGQTGMRTRHPGVQQLIGRCGHAGRAEGVVHHAGSPAPEDGYVLVCEQFGPMHRPELERAVALVVGKGAILDDGVTLARQSDLPVVYRVTDAWSLPEGIRVSVNATLGLVTRRPEG
jgi:phosphohistidine swiveling domain-containing protein